MLFTSAKEPFLNSPCAANKQPWLATVMEEPGLCVCGTYDGGIVGWDLHQDNTLKMIFAYTPHQGSVRSLAISSSGRRSGQLLVSGGADEHIRMYDLGRRAEVGELLHHNGTVTCLAFVDSSHLLSASDDGNICIWRMYDWSLLHILGGHKGAVTSLAVHPSGKLVLSTGRDRSLRLWDLVKGRCAYITRLEGIAESLRWTSDGSRYAMVVSDRRVDVKQMADNAVTGTYAHTQRVTALAFLDAAGSRVLTACDDLNMRVLDGDGGQVLGTTALAQCCGRIKEMVVLPGGDHGETPHRLRVVNASSDGKVVVWAVENDHRLTPLTNASLGEGVRITCLNAWVKRAEEDVEAANSKMVKTKAKKRPRNEPASDGAEREQAVLDGREKSAEVDVVRGRADALSPQRPTDGQGHGQRRKMRRDSQRKHDRSGPNQKNR